MGIVLFFGAIGYGVVYVSYFKEYDGFMSGIDAIADFLKGMFYTADGVVILIGIKDANVIQNKKKMIKKGRRILDIIEAANFSNY